jgi:hypothetical protein
MKTLRETLDQLDEISRRDLLKGAGAAAVAGAAGSSIAQNQSGRVAGLRAKLAREVGVLDVDSKNYDNISGAPKLFLFAENGSNFIMQWIDKEGNELGEPVVFGAGKNTTDARGNQITIFFGPKIAVKIQGDYIFVTPRSWIENKIGWQYAYSEVPNIFAMMKRESVNQGMTEGSSLVDRVQQIIEKNHQDGVWTGQDLVEFIRDTYNGRIPDEEEFYDDIDALEFEDNFFNELVQVGAFKQGMAEESSPDALAKIDDLTK